MRLAAQLAALIYPWDWLLTWTALIFETGCLLEPLLVHETSCLFEPLFIPETGLAHLLYVPAGWSVEPLIIPPSLWKNKDKTSFCEIQKNNFWVLLIILLRKKNYLPTRKICQKHVIAGHSTWENLWILHSQQSPANHDGARSGDQHYLPGYYSISIFFANI
jgi:hypothetical protein